MSDEDLQIGKNSVSVTEFFVAWRPDKNRKVPARVSYTQSIALSYLT